MYVSKFMLRYIVTVHVIVHVHPGHVAAQFLHLLSLSLSLFILISNITKFKNDYKGDNKLIQIKNRGNRKKSTHSTYLFIDISYM